MNSYQAAKQLRHLIRAITWNDSAAKVFAPNAVLVSLGPANTEILRNLGIPAAMIVPGNGSSDPEGREEPGLIQTDFVLTLVNVHHGDATGEAVLIGANASDIDSGNGRGLLEIEEQVISALEALTSKDGMTIQVYNFGATQGGPVEGADGAHAALRTYTLRALTTLTRSYDAATGFAAVDAGGGDADLTWSLPPSRFDYRRVIVRRAAGSTAPATATSGTGVTLGGSPDGVAAVSVTDSPTAGTWSYSLWVAYDDFGRDADMSYKASGTATVVVT